MCLIISIVLPHHNVCFPQLYIHCCHLFFCITLSKQRLIILFIVHSVIHWWVIIIRITKVMVVFSDAFRINLIWTIFLKHFEFCFVFSRLIMIMKTQLKMMRPQILLSFLTQFWNSCTLWSLIIWFCNRLQ